MPVAAPVDGVGVEAERLPLLGGQAGGQGADAVVLEDVNSTQDVEQIAEKMLKSIAAPMILSDQQVAVEASVGGAIYPEDGTEFSDLVEHARSAMQQPGRSRA